MPRLVLIVVSITVLKLADVCSSSLTCVNEERAQNKKACEGQIFGELVPYPGDCSKFLVCNCEYPTVKQCPGGTWFDNNIKTCNYPENVYCIDNEGNELTTSTTTIQSEEDDHDCKTPTGMSSVICLNHEEGFLLQYPYNCNAYINCTDECPKIKYCQTGKVYNDLLKICDTPDTAHCKELTLPTSSTLTTSTTTEITSTTEISWTTKDYNNEKTTLRPNSCLTPVETNASICSDSKQHIYHSYLYNCSAYIKCHGDLSCLEYCTEGKIFNVHLGICDDDIACQETALTESTTPFSTTSVTSSLPPHIDPGLCQGKNDYTVYPYEDNCNRYLLCENGEVQFKRCPDGWFFNKKLKLCDEAVDNRCLSENIPATVVNLCENQPAGMTFANKEDCQIYYYCRGNGQYFTIACPFKNFYDPHTGNCGPDVHDRACLEATTPVPTSTTEYTTLSSAEKCAYDIFGTTYVYEENCSKYIFCKGNGNFLIIDCPYNNYYYPATGNCGPSKDKNICRKTVQTTTDMTQTTTALPVWDICGNNFFGELIPYPGNCNKYISCVRPIPVSFYCPKNWRFNEQYQICIENAEGTCFGLATNSTLKPNYICQGQEKGTLRLHDDNCQLYYECLGNDNYMVKVCNRGKYFDPFNGHCSTHVSSDACWHYNENTSTASTVTSPLPQTYNICQNELLGTKVNYPENCFKYIICENPIPVSFKCASGLQFSLEQQACVRPSESNCETITKSTSDDSPTTPFTPKPFNICHQAANFTFLPYENDCSMFILCLQGNQHLAYCNAGEFYDIALEKCSRKANEYSCLLQTSTEPTITTTPSTPNSGPCYNKPIGTKITYPRNCTKYIECHEPLNVGYDCSQGLEFSKNQQKCVSPELADCSIKTTITIQHTTLPYTTQPLTTIPTTTLFDTSPALETCEDKPTGFTYAYLPDCSKYYICINGKQQLTNCMPQSFYNHFNGECENNISPYACTATTATTVTTTEATFSTTTAAIFQDLCHNQLNGTILVNIQNCSQYFICFQKSSIKCICTNNAFYNPQTEACDQLVMNSNCKVDTTTTESIYSTAIHTTTNEINQAESTTLRDLTASTIKPSSGNICCGQEIDTHLPYPGDETKYVVCKYPVPVIYVCPEGTLFCSSA